MFQKLRKNKQVEDVLVSLKEDRRILSFVPDKQNIRINGDRRGNVEANDRKGDMLSFIQSVHQGLRYEFCVDVKLTYKDEHGNKHHVIVKSKDVSESGMAILVDDRKVKEELSKATEVKVVFRIPPGMMPEGNEMRIKQKAEVVRDIEISEQTTLFGLQFRIPIAIYRRRRKDGYLLAISSLLLFIITFFIVMMRAESVIYFKFNKILYLYSIVAASFLLSRYFFGALYRPVPIDADFTPGVTILIPCFNEEEWIQRTIISCVNQDYPIDQLEVIVIDDCSTDRSVEKIDEIIETLKKYDEHYDISSRVSYIVQPQNAGKRDALAAGAKVAKHELVVFVDSDSFLDPFAIRHLVQPFKDPKVGGVSGRTDVANTYTNGLTKMQSVRYYIAFRIMKAAESFLDAVTCLSGPLSCYKKSIILENSDAWLNQYFLGQKATFGDDRAMTNFVLKKHRTCYQDTAICSTIVPNKYKTFLKQQMRWKRSWLRESIIAGTYMWKKEPFMAVFFYMGLLVPMLAPVIVTYNLIYVPITHHVFPTTFLVGMFLMAMLMSSVQLLLRRSSTWIFGMIFCFFYEAVLLWQMPIAWFTFWKSTWGTRMTPSDVKAKEKKDARAVKRRQQNSA